MKSFFKKLAFVMAMAMVVSLAAPAAQRAAAATEFTYAEQNEDGSWAGTGKVSSLTMKAGDKVDLGFVGVRDYKNYTLQWVSSNEAVATVDKNGVITAVANGVATVELQVGDGTDYVSTPVVVTVGGSMNVVLGTAKDDTFAEKTLKVGESIDLNFYGVTDWAAGKYACTWISTVPAVASVDKMGVVTALEAGTTRVTVVIQDKETGVILNVTPVEVTVGTDTVKESFRAHQTSHITFDVDFNKEVSYGRDNVYLYRVFDTDKGDVYVVWAVRKAELNNAKTTLTVEPYVQFGDGERYLVAFEDIETQLNEGTDVSGVNCYEFITHIGEIDNIRVSYSSTVNGQTVNNVAYTNGEDADEDIEVKLNCELYSGDVNLTEIYKNNNGYVEFELVNESNVSDFVTLSDDILVFTKEKITAAVKVKYVFEDAEGNEKVAESDLTPITAERLAPFGISRVVEWSLYKESNLSDLDWSKPVHTLRAGQIRNIALLIEDNRGVRWETVNKDDKILDFAMPNSDTEDMYLKFYSTDNDHFLVGDDENVGSVETYLQMRNAVIYVALHDEDLLDERDDDFVRNIGALVLNIDAPAKFNDVAIFNVGSDKTQSSVTLVTNAVQDPANPDRFIAELTTATYDVKLLDQDKAVYNPDNDPILTNTTIDYKLTTTNKDIREAMNDDPYGCSALQLENGKLVIDAAELNEITNSNTITATITATQYDESKKEIASKKVSFKIYLKDPQLFAEGETLGEWVEDDVKPTGWGLSVGNVGLMTTSGESAAKISVPILSKSFTVGYYNRYDMSVDGEPGSAIKVAESVDSYVFKKNLDTTKEGTLVKGEGIYVLVIGPDNKAVAVATDSALSASDVSASGAALGVYVNTTDPDKYSVDVKVTAADTVGGVVNYLATGKYTVKVTFVTKCKVDENGRITEIEYKTRQQSFTVTDDIDRVNFVDMYEVTTSLEPADNNDMATIKEIIRECYKFTYDVDNKNELKTWKPTAAQIEDVDYIIRGGYITVKSIKFKIATGGNYYETVTRNINRAVKLGVEED